MSEENWYRFRLCSLKLHRAQLGEEQGLTYPT